MQRPFTIFARNELERGWTARPLKGEMDAAPFSALIYADVRLFEIVGYCESLKL